MRVDTNLHYITMVSPDAVAYGQRRGDGEYEFHVVACQADHVLGTR